MSFGLAIKNLLCKKLFMQKQQLQSVKKFFQSSSSVYLNTRTAAATKSVNCYLKPSGGVPYYQQRFYARPQHQLITKITTKTTTTAASNIRNIFIAPRQLVGSNIKRCLYTLSRVKVYRKSIIVGNIGISMTSDNREISGDSTNQIVPHEVPSPTKGSLLRWNDIEKSQVDTREYRGLELENGLQVLLISDNETDVSAAALAVQVGHMSDPIELPGLAHFCEHMLFLGTEKYPNENGYTAFLQQSSGSSNAVTYSLMTKYHFHVTPDKLNMALDRFAQFFIAPLFTASATDRELNAVNSEHQKNLSSDLWRIKQVRHHLAKPDHPYSKFGSGNKATLCDIPKSLNIDVREELLKFHQKWYSANIMSLAVLGKNSLDELEKMVVEKFSEIENKNVGEPEWDREPYPDDQYATKVYIVPIKDLRSLSISFTTEDLTKHYKSSPECYLEHLIGHEAKGSILSELRKLGYCNGLRSGHHNTLNGFGFFDITVDLTQDGVYHVDDILHIIFQYLRMLRQEGPQKWIFDECVNINKTRFRFKDQVPPESAVTSAVAWMKIYPLQEVLSAPFLRNEWKPDLITELLDELEPKKCRIALVGQSYEQICTETEPYYGTKYAIEKIPEATIKRWEECELNPNLSLPEPNAFIGTNFELSKLDAERTKHPIIILDTPILRIWHKQDDKFLLPKGCMSVDLSNPIAYSDPLNRNLNQLMVTMLRDQLVELLYDAELAGLQLNLATKNSGIEMTIYGYNDKQIVLLETLLQRLFEFSCDRKRFEIMKDEYFRVLKNFRAEQPYHQTNYYLSVLMTETVWTNEDLIDTKELVTYERLCRYAADFFERLHAECFIYGNYTKEDALEVASLVNKRLEATDAKILPLLARQLLRRREYKLQNGDSYMLEKFNEYHKSSCTQLYFQMGLQTDRSNIMSQLIAQILTEPCYDCLRTKEQLGYIVGSGTRKVNGATGIRIIVQSTRHPTYVEDRIENFLSAFHTIIREMSVEEFNAQKEALTLKMLEKPKTINKQFSDYYNEISMAQYHFERRKSEIHILCSITMPDFIESFKRFISIDGQERRVLALHITSHEVTTASEGTELTAQHLEEMQQRNMLRHIKINDMTAFKASKELFPIISPAIDIRAKGARSKL